MRLQSWIVVGFATAVVAACGGSVSLGEIAPGGGTGTTSDGGSGGADGSSGNDAGAATECASKEACGPAPKSPAIQCSDGSLGGNTGRCLQTATGCAWEQRECPPDVCFDAAGALAPTYKKCATTTDCTVVDYAINCCGSMHAAGVNVASKAAVATCATNRAAGFPACDCAAMAPVADDGTSSAGASGITPSVTCNPSSGQCETSFKGEVCGTTTCRPGATCCSGVPLPAPKCFDNGLCPVSQRKHKKDITYLSEADRQRMSDELLRFPLATYRYKSESETDREHLGFIIDDVSPSPAVQQSGERVDMYGYQTMAVATLQVQARELAALRREVEELKAACRTSPKRQP